MPPSRSSGSIPTANGVTRRIYLARSARGVIVSHMKRAVGLCVHHDTLCERCIYKYPLRDLTQRYLLQTCPSCNRVLPAGVCKMTAASSSLKTTNQPHSERSSTEAAQAAPSALAATAIPGDKKANENELRHKISLTEAMPQHRLANPTLA